jgi:hypothetical protein
MARTRAAARALTIEGPIFPMAAAAGKTSGANLSPSGTRAPDHGRARRRAPGRSRGRNTAAVERLIAALRALDRVEDVDAGTLAVLRTTGAALDAAVGAYDVAVIARVHLAAIGALLAGHAATDGDANDQWLRRLLAEVRDPSDG